MFKMDKSTDQSVIDNVDILLYSDKYAMDKEIMDPENFQFNDGNSVLNMSLETPNLMELNDTFFSRGWISDGIIPRRKANKRLSDEGIAETASERGRRLGETMKKMTKQESMNMLKEYNEGFGKAGLQKSVAEMKAVAELLTDTNTFVTLNPEDEPDERSKELVKAMRIMLAAKDEEGRESVPYFERRSVMNMMDTLVTKSIKCEMEVDQEAEDFFNKNVSSGRIKPTIFHRFLLMDILDYSFKQYGKYFTDGFALIVHNVILKKMNMINIGAFNNLILPETVEFEDNQHIIRPVRGMEILSKFFFLAHLDQEEELERARKGKFVIEED